VGRSCKPCAGAEHASSRCCATKGSLPLLPTHLPAYLIQRGLRLYGSNIASVSSVALCCQDISPSPQDASSGSGSVYTASVTVAAAAWL